MGALAGNVDPEQLMRRGGGGLFGAPVAPGQYRIVLNVDGKEQTVQLLVEPDPVTGTRQIAAGGEPDDDIDDDEEEEEHEREQEMMRRLLDK
jgi:hypothetical protein